MDVYLEYYITILKDETISSINMAIYLKFYDNFKKKQKAAIKNCIIVKM